MREWASLSHVKWYCRYHVVFVPKYRKESIFAQLRKQIGEVLILRAASLEAGSGGAAEAEPNELAATSGDQSEERPPGVPGRPIVLRLNAFAVSKGSDDPPPAISVRLDRPVGSGSDG